MQVEKQTVLSGIRLNLSAEVGGFALRAELDLPATGITAIFGHSGSGKTTLLRCIAGLQSAKGELSVRGQSWQSGRGSLPVHKRPLAYVFQEASLFPHLSVRKNLEYGYSRIGKSERRIGFDEAVEWLGLSALLERMPGKLSGGERQRVAIARALLTSPEVLLMDEPLSALDYRSKQEILPYLERLHQKLSIPVLYVTHSADEVARLADYLVVMEKGGVVAAGELKDTLVQLDQPVRLNDEMGVVLESVVVERDSHWQLALARFDGKYGLWVPDQGIEVGSAVRLRVLASDVSLARQRYEDQSTQNLLPAVVLEFTEDQAPGVMLVRLQVGDTAFLSKITARSLAHLQLQRGSEVWLQVKSVAVIE